MLYDNLSVNADGHLTVAGYDTVELAKKYGTPLILMDEQRIRERARTYKTAVKANFPSGSMPIYAGKAFCCKRMYEIMKEEGTGIDFVSCGELFTALRAGFPVENAFFHGNNKTPADVEYAMNNRVGFFVADSFDELRLIEKTASALKIKQGILLRVSPGIDPDTHKKISTGGTDSKFGIPIDTGLARKAVECALSSEHIVLRGFHCHIGSQIFDGESFFEACDVMLKFVKAISDDFGYEPEYFDIGGGLGVRYVESQPEVDYAAAVAAIAGRLKSGCESLGLNLPKVIFEPGRSMVADSGVTLYTAGTVKEIPGFVNYVSIDGGMGDNPRYALYSAEYTVVSASRADAPADYTATVAGRFCESGDLIQENVRMPKPETGEILAVLTTGAYNYSMASNYNRIPRPQVVMLGRYGDYTCIRRETLADMCGMDL